MLACAALLFAACGGPAGEQGGQKPETRTEVTYGERIALVKPDLKAGLTINEALHNRRSWREYNAGALSLEELSGVLWAAAGVNRPEENRLTAPSALALYPIRVYALFAGGVYAYGHVAPALVRGGGGAHR